MRRVIEHHPMNEEVKPKRTKRRLDEVRRVDALPLLGTGKIDYKVLRAQIQ